MFCGMESDRENVERDKVYKISYPFVMLTGRILKERKFFSYAHIVSESCRILPSATCDCYREVTDCVRVRECFLVYTCS